PPEVLRRPAGRLQEAAPPGAGGCIAPDPGHRPGPARPARAAAGRAARVMALRVLTHVPLQLLERVRREVPDAELVLVPMQGEPPAAARGEVLLTHAKGSPNLAKVVERGVRWVHAYGTGVNDFPFAALGGRVLTCSRGSSAIPIAEWVLAMM